MQNEEFLYDYIGKWFIKEKGCQNDDFCKGYVNNMAVGKKMIPDITAMKYEVNDNNVTPPINFRGYVVEVKKTENVIYEDIGKIVTNRSSPDWEWGFNSVVFYVAYVKEETADQKIINTCKKEGIGLLTLTVYEDTVNNICEIIKPEESLFSGISHRQQASPGNFQTAVNNSYISKLLKDPDGMNLIRPKKEAYATQHH